MLCNMTFRLTCSFKATVHLRLVHRESLGKFCYDLSCCCHSRTRAQIFQLSVLRCNTWWFWSKFCNSFIYCDANGFTSSETGVTASIHNTLFLTFSLHLLTSLLNLSSFRQFLVLQMLAKGKFFIQRHCFASTLSKILNLILVRCNATPF